LLAGEVETAARHWEKSANYFRYIDQNIEAEKRFEYSTRLREYAYRYRSADALFSAEQALKINLCLRQKNDEKWCREMIALGVTHFRLSQFDVAENFVLHINLAKSLFERVRDSCSETVLTHYYVVSQGNLAMIYSMREFAKSDDEYRSNIAKSLELQNDALSLVSKIEEPERWGILQHNLGHSYTYYSRIQSDSSVALDMLNRAIYHADLSFEVRDWADEETLQYWVASCRTLGEALIERSRYQTNIGATSDLNRAFAVLSDAASKISETEHPNQWEAVQKQLVICSEQRLRLASR
jgi:hypothetical protein